MPRPASAPSRNSLADSNAQGSQSAKKFSRGFSTNFSVSVIRSSSLTPRAMMPVLASESSQQTATTNGLPFIIYQHISSTCRTAPTWKRIRDSGACSTTRTSLSMSGSIWSRGSTIRQCQALTRSRAAPRSSKALKPILWSTEDYLGVPDVLVPVARCRGAIAPAPAQRDGSALAT